MRPIADILLNKEKKTRYNGTKKYKETMHIQKCIETQEHINTLIARLRNSTPSATLKSIDDVIQKIRLTIPLEKQNNIIKKIIKARLLID